MALAQKYTGIGLMSGTSLDGLDIAYCEFILEGKVSRYKILEAETIKYSSDLAERLENSINISGLELALLNNDLGTWIGRQCVSFINKNSAIPDFISSHGHTIYHQPERKMTFQIGNGNIIHAITKVPVVFDFRSLDVALGGQGAPLVPIGDEQLFSEYQVCMNLGGFANISFDDDLNRKAYDVCGVNIVLNKLAQETGHPFDRGGEIARSGSDIKEFREILNKLPYYAQPWPKSLGKEWVEKEVMTIIDGFREHTIEDILHTYTNHIANRIAAELNNLKKTFHADSSCHVLVTGGGAYNDYLVENIKSVFLPGIQINIPDDTLIAFKEALIFAFMGLLRIKGLPNCLRSVTGAASDTSCGVIAGSIQSQF